MHANRSVLLTKLIIAHADENSIHQAEFSPFDYASKILHVKIGFNENELSNKSINGVPLKLSVYNLVTVKMT